MKVYEQKTLVLFGKFNNDFSIAEDFSYGYFTFWLEVGYSCSGSTACSHPFQVELEVSPQSGRAARRVRAEKNWFIF